MIIRDANLLHFDRMVRGADVRITNGSIREIGTSLDAGTDSQVIEARGGYVLPGLIDLHTHGLRDVNVQYDSLLSYSAHQLAEGVTACIPTFVGTPDANVEAMQKGLRETDNLAKTPNIIGFRPEISYVAKTGAGQRDSLFPITAETTERLWNAADGKIVVWDVAPELNGAVEFVQWARDHGIVVSLAHSSATIEQARRAVDAGLSLVTHFYDTFDVPQQVDPGVYPAGLTDYLLIDDRVSLEVIPDGVHVHPVLLEKVLRCKGIDHVVMITDSVKGAGNPPGIYDGLYKGVKIQVTEDRGMRRIPDGTLSGSAITQITGFRNMVNRFGRSIREASIVGSRTPAQVLGLSTKGHLAVGMDADIMVLDSALQVQYTIVGGSLLYSTER